MSLQKIVRNFWRKTQQCPCHMLKCLTSSSTQQSLAVNGRSFVCNLDPARKAKFFRFQNKRQTLTACTYATFSQKTEEDMSVFPVENIRNFCIIAHVDHGKSTLADRLLEITGAINISDENKQVLDKLQVERERGITVKAQTASLFYKYKGKMYLLNLIDTPGHVDFNYEVSRSMKACQGAVLLVDANQGIQAQTVANFFLAFESNIFIVPVLSKIDLKNADPENCRLQMQKVFDISPEDVLEVSGKTGTGVTELLHAIIDRVPPPSTSDPHKPFRALVFDSWFDRYRGVVANIAIIDGTLRTGEKFTSAHSKKSYEVQHLGILRPNEETVSALYAGQVGFVMASMKNTAEARIGDTFYSHGASVDVLPGFKPAKPMVFAGMYPIDQTEFPTLRSAISRLTLNDSSVTMTMDSSPALGQGFRIGFLGLLHMDVFNQRLEQEYSTSVIVTAPSVPYKFKIKGEKNIKKHGSEIITIVNPCEYPDESIIVEKYEPMVSGTILCPADHINVVSSACMERRGEQTSFSYIDNKRVMVKFSMPLSEVIIDFYDELKTMTSGYASFDYEDDGYQQANLVKLRILINGRDVEELTHIVHAESARLIARRICEKLRDAVPRQLFEVSIQAVIGDGIKPIVRENVKALKKNVTAKLYGGDVTRKMKLLRRQTEGKKRMKSIGNVEIPRDAFVNVLKR